MNADDFQAIWDDANAGHRPTIRQTEALRARIDALERENRELREDRICQRCKDGKPKSCVGAWTLPCLGPKGAKARSAASKSEAPPWRPEQIKVDHAGMEKAASEVRDAVVVSMSKLRADREMARRQSEYNIHRPGKRPAAAKKGVV